MRQQKIIASGGASVLAPLFILAILVFTSSASSAKGCEGAILLSSREPHSAREALIKRLSERARDYSTTCQVGLFVVTNADRANSSLTGVELATRIIKMAARSNFHVEAHVAENNALAVGHIDGLSYFAVYVRGRMYDFGLLHRLTPAVIEAAIASARQFESNRQLFELEASRNLLAQQMEYQESKKRRHRARIYVAQAKDQRIVEWASAAERKEVVKMYPFEAYWPLLAQ